ncbi:PrsW family intramembrane metalloprotease [Granulicoccus phenolivorans]|uniref:PrsW family intramembrane metalloprotease n=1 Tax=Granulicoccus phenolivorans TaxID=266854 RepID=UPI0003FD2BBB|nr:PrsW family intramembrane metalloprotease [Granulicoccus phenolivorans]
MHTAAPPTRPADLSAGAAGAPAPDAERRALRRSGLPISPPAGENPLLSLVKNPRTWLVLGLILLEVICAWRMYAENVPDRQVPGGTLLGLGVDQLPLFVQYASYTAVPLALLFILLDRFWRPRPLVWLLTFGWGAFVATYAAMHLNTWAASHLGILGNGDPATASRAAVFVAPFVEEATKASVLFLLAIFFRNQWVNRMTGIALGGLVATGFAWIENVLYYGRAYRAAANSTSASTLDPEQAMQQLVFVRGGLTFFAHPMFTCMTGIGLAIALRHRSKIVRVVAPLCGYLAAALGHMWFNGTLSTVTSEATLLMLYLLIAVPVFLSILVMAITQLFTQARLVRARLEDYARTGWLLPTDPRNMASLRRRLVDVVVAFGRLLTGNPRSFVSTVRIQWAMLELAYLRDGMVRGLIDEAGHIREKVLLRRIRELRPTARVGPPSQAPADTPWIGPGAAPAAYLTPQYSPVNPSWGPPGR